MNTSEILGGSVGSPGRVQRSPLSQRQDYMSKYTWRKHDVEELHNSDDLQEISKLAHLAILRLRDALWRRNGNSIKLGAIPTSILYERAEWESVQHEVFPFFDFDEVGLFCSDILEQVGRAQEVREARSRAGKTSAQVRNEQSLNNRSTHVQQVFEQNSAGVQQDVQQRRGEENREDIRGDEADGDKSPKPKRKRFVIPTVEEVSEYLQSEGHPNPTGTAKDFWDYWQTWEWKRKGTQMSDWKASVRTWVKNERNFGRKTNDPQMTLEQMQAIRNMQ